MDTDPGILCFQHCGFRTFCFKMPTVCPTCRSDLSTAHFQILPFRIPYPFVRAIQYPCCIVIKPTKGDFLNDYLNSMDLHIGVTTSAGEVVEFDKTGLQKDRSACWEQCLVLDGVAGPWMEFWDNTLEKVADPKFWSSYRYDEDKFNCYTFVLTFLRKLQYGELSKAAKSRTTFCENFIVPRTIAAGKYISLYRKLQLSDCYVYEQSSEPSVTVPVSFPNKQKLS